MDDFSTRLNQTRQQMYDRLATCEAGQLRPAAIERGLDLLIKLGYPEKLLQALPPESLERTFPLANPLTKIAELNPETIIDLGCGTALDLFCCAKLLPQLKSLTGVDASQGLLDTGRKRLEKFSSSSARTTLFAADINQLESLNLGYFDLILMNGSFNLIYDKAYFLQQASRTLTGKGRILIYDFLLVGDLPPGFSEEIDNWLWNIGGALDMNRLTEITDHAGLQLISVKELECIDPVARCEILLTNN